MRDSKRGITSEGEDEISDVLLRSALPCIPSLHSKCQVKRLCLEAPRHHMVKDLLICFCQGMGDIVPTPTSMLSKFPARYVEAWKKPAFLESWARSG